MITVEQALANIADLITPLPAETVPLLEAAGRVLARPVAAIRNQPPFAASAMDGYALLGDEVAPNARFTVIGESAAGHRFSGTVNAGQAARIFTGAPVPSGATRIVIQEDVTRSGDEITLNDNLDPNTYIRPAAADFKIGDTLAGPRVLQAADIALLAAMNIHEVPVTRRPTVALIATGDELVMPSETPGPDQIIASNCFGLAAMVSKAGATPRLLPIARDNKASLITAFELAKGADLIVTIGGASVGDHDLVAPVAAELGMKQSFYKVAMRPGKPLMAGRIGKTTMIGLPGNPVSSMVCGTVFLVPTIRALLGLSTTQAPRFTAKLSQPLPPNSKREHYMRARLTSDGIFAYGRQDSSLLTVLSDANALIVRPINDPAKEIGQVVDYIPL